MKKALVVVILAAVSVSCVRIPPRRILPMEISRVYIPMVENKSYEPGLEENLTRFLQEEFMLDGRLDVVRPQYADVVVRATLVKFGVTADIRAFDEFPLTNRLLALADVQLYDPLDRKKEKPLMTWRDIEVETSYASDMRLINEVSPQDALEDAMRLLARRIVLTVITSQPEEYAEMLEAAKEIKPAPPEPALGAVEVDTRLLNKKAVKKDEADEKDDSEAETPLDR